MKRTRYSEEQIIGILTEHEAGAKCADLCRLLHLRQSAYQPKGLCELLPDLKQNSDGGVTPYIQSDSPGADLESNWLLARCPFSMDPGLQLRSEYTGTSG